MEKKNFSKKNLNLPQTTPVKNLLQESEVIEDSISPNKTSPKNALKRPGSPLSSPQKKIISEGITKDDQIPGSPRRSPRHSPIRIFENKDISSPAKTIAPCTPKSCLKTPNKQQIRFESIKKSLFGSQSPTKGVVFHQVEVRQYERSLGLGSGIPDSGGYALSLDWDYDKNTLRQTLSDYEKQREEEERPSLECLERIHEDKRKEIIVQYLTPTKTTVSEAEAELIKWKRQNEEEVKIRKSRESNGCKCSGAKSCNTAKCICIKNQIECNEDSCGCTANSCKNPLRHSYNEKKVQDFRKEKLKRLNNSPTKNSPKNSPTKKNDHDQILF